MSNSSSIDRMDEVVEVEIADADSYAVYTAQGKPIQAQTTYDGKLIFCASVAAKSSTKYLLRKELRVDLDTIATGAVFPQWYDDFAWENDKIGFRAYSDKILKMGGTPLYGYDIFTKRSRTPVLDVLYNTQFDKYYGPLIRSNRESNPSFSKTLSNATTYHLDHGFGVDYYVVGPTLGSGTAALIDNGEILYPLYHSKSEILDRGGLRVTFRLTFAPVKVGEDMVQEVRTITLDKGSHFNHIEVEYLNLTSPREVVVGIVLHDSGECSRLGKGFIAYAEPKHYYGWQTYNAVIYPESKSSEVALFAKPRGNALGHILTKGEYSSDTKMQYYMGAGWNRWGFPTAESWFGYVEQQQQRYNEPLRCEVK